MMEFLIFVITVPIPVFLFLYLCLRFSGYSPKDIFVGLFYKDEEIIKYYSCRDKHKK